jgi:hypothetical protein
MLPEIRYRTQAERKTLLDWFVGQDSDMKDLHGCEEHLAVWCESHFEASTLTIQNLRPENEAIFLFLSSDAWKGTKEVAFLKDGSLAW